MSQSLSRLRESRRGKNDSSAKSAFDLLGTYKSTDAWEHKPIVEVVEAHLDLKELESGLLVGLCPFHDDKSASFQVMPKVGRCKCWSCWQHGGDGIAFIQKLKGCSFEEAVAEATYPVSTVDSMLSFLEASATVRVQKMLPADYRKIFSFMLRVEAELGTQASMKFYNESLKCQSSEDATEILGRWRTLLNGWNRQLE